VNVGIFAFFIPRFMHRDHNLFYHKYPVGLGLPVAYIRILTQKLDFWGFWNVLNFKDLRFRTNYPAVLALHAWDYMTVFCANICLANLTVIVK